LKEIKKAKKEAKKEKEESQEPVKPVITPPPQVPHKVEKEEPVNIVKEEIEE
jgi:hypothetical protein